MAEEALALARHMGDAATEAYALITAAEARGRSAPVGEALAMLARARSLAEQAEAHDPYLQTFITESHLLEGLGEHERAAQVAWQGVNSAAQYGLARATGTLLAASAAEPLTWLGRWDEAADVIEHALEVSPPPGTLTVLLQLSGGLALARGDLPGAAQSAAASRGALAALGYRDQTHLPLAMLETELHVAQARPGDAVATAEQALARPDLRQSSRYAWPLLEAAARACVAAFTAAATGRDQDLAGRARRLLDRLRALAETIDAYGPLEQAHQLAFTAESVRAAAVGIAPPAAGTGPDADALDAWDAAAQAWQRLDSPYPLACALLHAAEAALDRGDREGATGRLARAAPLADSLAAGPLCEQIGSLVRRARLRIPAGAAREQTGGTFGLTARETEVLRLVAAGRSNRDIAAELFISAKTASVHVSNILAKLNVATRTEAAAIAHRSGLAADDS
jgi:DNA-binding NarL/FixJ family response regulator